MRLLEKKIKNGSHVLLMNSDDADILKYICAAVKKRKLSNVEVWHCMQECKEIYARYISAEDMSEIMQMYRLYDFSDKVIALTDSVQYGTLLNYVSTGTLTKEEVAEALLYKL